MSILNHSYPQAPGRSSDSATWQSTSTPTRGSYAGSSNAHAVGDPVASMNYREDRSQVPSSPAHTQSPAADTALLEKLSRAKMVIEAAEAEFASAAAEKQLLERERADIREQQSAAKQKVTDLEERCAFLLRESSAAKKASEEHRLGAIATEERAKAAEQRITALEGQLKDAVREGVQQAEARSSAVERQYQTTQLQFQQEHASTVSELNDTLRHFASTRDQLAKQLHHQDLINLSDKERSHRLAILASESDSRCSVWELVARVSSASYRSALEVAHTAVVDAAAMRGALRTAAVHPLPMAASPNAIDEDALAPQSLFASSMTASQHVLAIKIKDLETALGNSAAELERERAASRQLRDALQVLYTGEAVNSSASVSTGHRKEIASILQAGEMAKMRSAVDVERSRADLLSADLAKTQLNLRETTDECASLTAECESLTQSLRKVSTELRQCKCELADEVVRREDAERKLEVQAAECVRTAAKLNAAHALEHQLTADLESAVAVNQRLEGSLSSANSRLHASVDAFVLQREVESIAAERDAAVSGVHRLNTRLSEMTKSSVSIVVHQQEVSELREKLAATEARLQSLESSAVDGVAAAARSADDAAKLTAARATITHQEQALASAMAAAERSAVSQAQQAAAFQDRINAYVSEVGTLRFQLQSSQQRLLEYSHFREHSRADEEPEPRYTDDDHSSEVAFMASKLLLAADEIEQLTAERDRLQEQVDAFRTNTHLHTVRLPPSIPTNAVALSGKSAVTTGLRTSVVAQSPSPSFPRR